MLNFVLCDDNIGILNKLEKMLEAIFIQNNLSGKISFSTPNPKEVINYIEKNQFDVIVLDIDLKAEISGLSLASIIRQKNKNVYIIFTTAHLEYSMLAYKYKTFDFIAKPITQERLEETILRLYDDICSETNTEYFKLNKKNYFINQDDIFYIQKNGKKAVFKTKSKDYEINSSFDNIMQKLPNNFVRCHRSYIVNVQKISSINSNNTIIFKDDFSNQCYIGPKYGELFKEVFNDGNASRFVEDSVYRR